MRFAGVGAQQIVRHRAEALSEAESQMAAFIGAAGLTGRAAWRIDYGYPITTLESEVEAVKPDLLVLGKHGRSMVEQWMVGSVAGHLARVADCDVLIVPGPSS
jgi:nucleotide-binding universal stress UspA family protein